MKRQLLYFFLICFLASCLEEQNNPLTIASCTDKIKNQNEVEIDCGGICQACIKEPEAATVPCKSTLVKNRITLNGVNKNLSSEDFGCYQESDYYEIYIYKDYTEIIIRLYNFKFPNKTIAIPLVPYYSSKSGSASIKVTDFYNYNSLSGNLYASKENNSLVIELCSLDLAGQGSTYKISGKIVCE
jgi:hypothetical protein